MLIDRIVIDILDWIKRSLFFRRGQKIRQPYEVLEEFKAERGWLKKVQRDTPRAVRTWVLVPFPREIEGYTKRSEIREVHICLDHLFALEGQKAPPRSEWRLTHRIHVLSASRYLSPDGNFQAETIFVKNYDMLGTYGQTTGRDRTAIAIIDQIAKIVGKFGWEKLEWEMEIELSRKQFMGKNYVSSNPYDSSF